MSITTSAIPVFFLSSLVADGILSIIPQVFKDKNSQNGTNLLHLDSELVNKIQEKEFETVFIDSETLIKTLIEHGGNIKQERIGYIKCEIEDISLEFYKKTNSETVPYYLKIRFCDNQTAKELIEEISNEYTFNTQEASYNKIIKRLEAKNLQYEEEVYDDDSIVITVSLD